MGSEYLIYYIMAASAAGTVMQVRSSNNRARTNEALLNVEKSAVKARAVDESLERSRQLRFSLESRRNRFGSGATLPFASGSFLALQNADRSVADRDQRAIFANQRTALSGLEARIASSKSERKTNIWGGVAEIASTATFYGGQANWFKKPATATGFTSAPSATAMARGPRG